MDNRLKVLIAEDDASLRDSCASVLVHSGYDVVASARGDDARELLLRQAFDIVLLDLHMAQVSGMELMRVALETHPETLVIIITGDPDVESSLAAMREGAWEYLPKPFTATHLHILLGRARHLIETERRSASENAGAHAVGGKGAALIGRSPAFLNTLRLTEKVARTDASVFLTGESGSGKELFAHFIHQQSRRAKRAFVAINCAALPETLLESEMFGHVKGAFTGAIRDKPGLLEAANGGTFFLDELTEMSLPIQAKLLRAIQDGKLRRVGSEAVDAKVDVRFISATNRDPHGAAEQGLLREDLYFRLSVVPIRIPPLRERPEDIPLLAESFLGVYWRKHREKASRLPRFTPAALWALQMRPWVGNVRELQNVVEHTVLLVDPGSDIGPDDLPAVEEFSPGRAGSGGRSPTRRLGELKQLEYHEARERVVADFEVEYIRSLIERTGVNLSLAAKLAGVDRTTLYRLMEKHGLHRSSVLKETS